MKLPRVCATPGCWLEAPCPTHSRPRNASWSKDRDRSRQREFREATLARDHYTCTRCGHQDMSGKTLQAHHDTPTAGRTLCRPCHKAVDAHAR